jgi:hypothetical protein
MDEMWLIYNDEVMANVMGPITTHFVDKKDHDHMLALKDCVLAQGIFENDTPSAVRVEWYSRSVYFGVERFSFKGFWPANRTREEALIVKYGSLENLYNKE